MTCNAKLGTALGRTRNNPDTVEPAPSIRIDALYEALWALVGPSATLATITEQPALLELAHNLARDDESSPEQLAVRVREEIVAASRALDDPGLAVEPRYHREGAAVLTLLGLATGYHSAPLHRRRDGAAGLLGYEVGTAFKTRPGVRSHAQNAFYAVADKLFEQDIQNRTQAAPVLLTEQRQQISAVTMELLRRYEAYYAMYTPLTALRADLLAALGLHGEGDDELNRFDDFVVSSLHAYAEFLIAKRNFMEHYHGIWIFAQADIEKAVADAIKFIEHFSGLRYREESVLRLERSPHRELHHFALQLDETPEGRQALRRWRERIMECTCDLEQLTGECRMHRLIRACEYYIVVLDTDWYRMIPWHHGPPQNIDAVDPGTLYRDVGLG